MSIFRSLTWVISPTLRRFLRPSPLVPHVFVLQPAGINYDDDIYNNNDPDNDDDGGESTNTSIWFAVPKSKVSPGKKRMKTTLQKRIILKKNIIFDQRTGEITLMHKLPLNWKDYLPKMEDFGLSSYLSPIGAAASNIKLASTVLTLKKERQQQDASSNSESK